MSAGSAPGLSVTQDEQDIEADAAVAAAIRVHERVQRGLRRLAKATALPGSDGGVAATEAHLALHQEAVYADNLLAIREVHSGSKAGKAARRCRLGES